MGFIAADEHIKSEKLLLKEPNTYKMRALNHER